MTILDWSDPAHWGGGQLRPCRLCGQPALCVDDAGRPAHKICVEAALDTLTRKD